MSENLLRILKFFINTTVIIFLVTLLINYAYLEEPVSIWLPLRGQKEYLISRDFFFYGNLTMFFVIQMIFLLFTKLILDKSYSQGSKIYLSIWFRGMILTVNLFIIFMIIFTGLSNNAGDYQFSSIVLPAYAGPALMFIWIILFPVFFRKSKQINTGNT